MTTASVVQTEVNGQPNGTDPWTPTATLASTPTQNNLLYAVVFYRGASAPVAASGWTLDQTASYPYSSPPCYLASYWKYAGASEPTTITPNTSSGTSASIIVWEVSGVPLTFAAAKAFSTCAVHYPGGATTSDGSSFNSDFNGTLMLDAWLCYTPSGAGVGTVSLSPFTTLGSYNAVGGSSGVTITAIAGSDLLSSAGSVSDTITFSIASVTNNVSLGLKSSFVPPNTEGTSKINAWAMIGPPTGVQVVSKITGYTMVGPRPNSAYVWVMS